MRAEYSEAAMSELAGMVKHGLRLWCVSPNTAITLLSVSENATYAVHDPLSERERVLRVHRVGYSSEPEIRSELAWINALRSEGVIDTAAPVLGTNGELVQVLTSTSGLAARHAVLFERLPGREPEPGSDTANWFERLGELNARMHRHARSWKFPPGFRRKTWDVDAMVGPHGHWGSWRAALGLNDAGAAVIERALLHIEARLERFGRAPERFGLVHADLRLANLLAEGEHLRIIDFDDCGFSWFIYDFATAVSFIEHQPLVPDLLRAWLLGYRKVAPMSAQDAAEIPTVVVLRRILLTAWVASHAEVPLAQRCGALFTEGSVALAQRWLDGEFLA